MAWVAGRGECPNVAAGIEFNGMRVAYFDKVAGFANAERWWEENRERLSQEHPGMQLVLNAVDLTHVVVERCVSVGGKLRTNDCYECYTAAYGKTPHHGRLMFYVVIPPR